MGRHTENARRPLKNPVAHFVNVVLCLQTHAEDEDDAVTTQDSTDELALGVCSLRALDSEANHSSFPIDCILYFIDVPFCVCCTCCRKLPESLTTHAVCMRLEKLEWKWGWVYTLLRRHHGSRQRFSDEMICSPHNGEHSCSSFTCRIPDGIPSPPKRATAVIVLAYIRVSGGQGVQR